MQELSWPHRQALYLRGTSYGYWLGSVGPALLIYFILRHNHFPLFHYWIAAHVTVATISTLWRRQAYGLLMTEKISWTTLNIISIGVLAMAASLWAYISCGIFPAVSVDEQSFICMMLTGVAAGSLPVNSASRLLSRLTLTALILPLCWGAYQAHDQYGGLVAFATMIYLFVMLKAANVFHTMMQNEFHTAVHNHYLRRQLEEKTAGLVTQAQNASLGEMAGNMAHEINNPLTTVTASIDLLKIRLAQKDVPRDQLDMIIEKMQSNVERVTKIIKGLRHFSRNTVNDDFSHERVNTLFGQTVQLCQERLESENIQLVVRACAENLMIECRGPDICHVLLNLINNSRDAIEGASERWIRVQARDTDDGRTVEIRVTDSGGGIAKANQDKIMEPFFTTKGSGKGVGLGLSVAQSIVKAHGGTLELDKSCKNTSFVVRLPVVIYDQMKPGQAA